MISLDEILSFIIPAFLKSDSLFYFREDILQTIFFTLIISIFLFTLLAVLINAKEKNWSKKWYVNGEERKFKAEYVTVEGVSSAVETKTEKFAEAMPSILLTIGLLGTFIGLGIALDKASSILSETNAIDNTDNQMIQLMAMLDGLGAKFKTSTWGLTAFIVLKFSLSAIGYESKRLNWSAKKVKEELEFIEINKNKDQQGRDNLLSNGFSELINVVNENINLLNKSNENKLEMLTGVTKDLLEQTKLESSEQKIRFENRLDIDKSYNSAAFEQMRRGFDSVTSELSTFGISVKEQISSFNLSVSSELEALNLSTKDLLAEQVKTTGLQKEFIEQNKDVRDAMLSFIEKNESVVDALGQSATNMSEAASGMGESAEQLEHVITNLRTDMEGVINLLKDDLGSSIAGMNTSFSKNMSSMSIGLQATITDMNNSFKTNIVSMSDNLRSATSDISVAVNELSSSVSKTMDNVTSTIKESMDIQVKAQNLFTVTSDNLNEHVDSMTGLVNKLSGDIQSGLDAISKGSQQTAFIGKQLIEITEELGSVLNRLNVLEDLNRGVFMLENTLKNRQGTDLKPIVEIKERQHNDNQQQFMKIISEITDSKKQLIFFVEQLSKRIDNSVVKADNEISKTISNQVV